MSFLPLDIGRTGRRQHCNGVKGYFTALPFSHSGSDWALIWFCADLPFLLCESHWMDYSCCAIFQVSYHRMTFFIATILLGIIKQKYALVSINPALPGLYLKLRSVSLWNACCFLQFFPLQYGLLWSSHFNAFLKMQDSYKVQDNSIAQPSINQASEALL